MSSITFGGCGPVRSTYEINHCTEQVKIMKHGPPMEEHSRNKDKQPWPGKGCVRASVIKERGVREAWSIMQRLRYAGSWETKQGIWIYSESNVEETAEGRTNNCHVKHHDCFWDLSVACAKYKTGHLAVFALLNNESLDINQQGRMILNAESSFFLT